ncbi:MAG: PAS domain-containing protein, partial [Candidatus Uhrbacteria bacterium]|nr:PAS domain-containing protein [Candidatus Uhrbacteria bacterium]
MHFEENYPRKLQPKKSTHMELFSASPLSPMARLLLEETTNHITFTDIDGRILFANTAAQRFTGYTFEEMRGNTPRLWGGLMGHDFYERLWKTIKI